MIRKRIEKEKHKRISEYLRKYLCQINKIL